MVRLTDELTPKRAEEIDKTCYIPEFEGECPEGESETITEKEFIEGFGIVLKEEAPLIKTMLALAGRRD